MCYHQVLFLEETSVVSFVLYMSPISFPNRWYPLDSITNDPRNRSLPITQAVFCLTYVYDKWFSITDLEQESFGKPKISYDDYSLREIIVTHIILHEKVGIICGTQLRIAPRLDLKGLVTSENWVLIASGVHYCLFGAMPLLKRELTKPLHKPIVQ